MDTAYKTRTWWIFRSLSYAYASLEGSENPKQVEIWNKEGDKAAANACAPSGSPCLTRQYVDRQGNLLPHLLAS